MKFELLDVVRATADVPAFGVKAGDLGTVVEAYADGDYEVEFCNEQGETFAMFALPGETLRPAHSVKQAA
jgi:Domain of unknown function (DUF4926)